MSEVWKTILFVVAIPLVQQFIKLIVDRRGGEPLGKLANQAISLVLAAVFFVLSGGIAGLHLPALPGCSDLVFCIGGYIDFASEMVVVVGLAWGGLMAIYELVWDRLFVRINLATMDKYY